MANKSQFIIAYYEKRGEGMFNRRRENSKEKRKISKKHKTGDHFSHSLEKNFKQLQTIFSECGDLVFHEFVMADNETKALIAYIDGLVDKDIVHHFVLKPLVSVENPVHMKYFRRVQEIKEHILSVSGMKIIGDMEKLIHHIMSGDTALLVEGNQQALIIGTREWNSRSIEEPLSESNLRGPRDGFVETLQTNIAMVRRRIKDPRLKIKITPIGTRSKTDVAIAYVQDICDDELLKEVERRLGTIETDEILDSGYIEEFIQDSWLSPFPQLQYTERPDRVVSAIMEGRVAIMVDGTPQVLLAPVTFPQLFQSADDYYDRWMIGSLIRVIRLFAAVMALTLPSLYIALVSFHPGMIPTKLLISITASRSGVPFPSVMEAFLMELTIELLREAGVRLPRVVGQTVGIVGGLIIGEAAVQAGIASRIMVVVVAITAIASFLIPSFNVAISLRMLRFLMMISAVIMGIYGVILVLLVILTHLITLKSFGTDYFSPFVPYRPGDWKDLLVRVPIIFMKNRPEMLQARNRKRLKIYRRAGW
ncbi:spore germination protein [Microaerobacter geothermalis]|uniref:spore germination protein n=1 Tax=Microaerobacter geothermalis TaxID=674972 RepID=UPI001F238544|nr:spore germination protein [Microaerobacter geothermalis]MCF6094470.1 spore germination protein [Microaerobacter geothermalis]